ncbi:MAG: NAD(P)-binding domain-containing protein [Proteobacteria bacterium]|nr:NAD(P)-binding domain-containing protein [Pseudomonadota bacterium]
MYYALYISTIFIELPQKLLRKDFLKDQNQKRIAIIGAGATGLVAAKSALEENLVCDVYESTSDIGGVWRPDGLAWPGMTVNISRYTGVFSDFTWEQAFPNKGIDDYPTREEMYDYLCAYVNHFKLKPYIHLSRRVIQISKKENKWVVRSQEGNEIRDEYYDSIILATGRYQAPHLPKFEGLEKFTGETLHSAEYRSKDFSNKTVLVIGGSISGTAIAEDIANNSHQTIHLIRRPRWVVPKRVALDPQKPLNKIPNDLFHSRKTYKRRDYSWYIQYCAEQNRIPALEVLPGTSPPSAVSNRYLEKVHQGNIEVIKDEVSHFTESGVVLKSGCSIKVDCVIFCTGYLQDFSYLDQNSVGNFTSPLLLYEDTFHPDIPDLACIGLNYQLRGAIFPLIELQARWASAVFSGRLNLPSVETMQNEIATMQKPDGITFSRALAMKLGVYDFSELAKSDPKLYDLAMKSAIIPAQYRLVGQGSNPSVAEVAIRMTEEYRHGCLGKVNFFQEESSTENIATIPSSPPMRARL